MGPCQPLDSEGRKFTVSYITVDGQRLMCKDYERPPKVAPIIDSDAYNLVLLSSRDPRAALSRIGTLVQEAKHDLRVGEHNRAFGKLNKIGWLSGRLA